MYQDTGLNRFQSALSAACRKARNASFKAWLTALSGSLYAHFGPAGFWAMSGLCMGALPTICSLPRYLRTPQIRPNAAAEGCYSNT